VEFKQPSETYLIFQRTVTFLDEWMFYGLLLYLFIYIHDGLGLVVAAVGALAIRYSYKRMWAMEKMRFGPLEPDSKPTE